MRLAHSGNQQRFAYLGRIDQDLHYATNAGIRAEYGVGSLVATGTASRVIPWDDCWFDVVENGEGKVGVVTVGIVVDAGIGNWAVIVVELGW